MKWIKKQRIITICLKGVLAMVILSAMLGLAACQRTGELGQPGR